MKTPTRQTGFTLIELAIVLAIVSLLMGSAVPSLADYIKSVRVSGATSDLYSAILFARSEAVKSNQHVVLCKSADAMLCVDSGGWEQGWIAFEDSNGDGVHGASEPILLRGQPMAGGLRVTGNGSLARYVSYAPDGMAKLVGGGFQAGTITVCRQSLEAGDARQIIMNAGGRPRMQKQAVASCA